MAEEAHGSSASLEFKKGNLGGGVFRYIPVFLYVLVLYLLGKAAIHNPLSDVAIGHYHWAWVDVLYFVAAILAIAEQMKVSHPGIDNTLEALLMVAMGVVQLLLFVLGAAGVKGFSIFSDAQFFMLMVISLAASVVAVLINARTLRRTIGVGDN